MYSMRVLIQSVVIFLFPLLCCEAAKPMPVPAPPATPVPAQGLSAATRELFAWFDKLGFEDNTRAKFVTYRPSVTQKDVIREAFILEEDRESIRVQGADLMTHSYRKGSSMPWRDEKGCRVVPIEKRAGEILREMRDPKYFDVQENAFSGMGGIVSRPSQIVIIARACARRGQEALAQQLVESMEHHPYFSGRPKAFPQFVREDIAERAGYWVYTLFDDTSRSWRDLAEIERLVVARASEHQFSYFREPLTHMDRLVAEEAEHTSVSDQDLAKMAPAEKSRELVWRLRNDPGPADETPAEPQGWVRRGPVTNPTMNGLRAMGMEAVPALLAELRAEPRLSRASRGLGFCTRDSGGLLFTHDLAAQLLDEITGLALHILVEAEEEGIGRLKFSRYADQWWQAVQEGKEQVWLADAVRKGGVWAQACAARLNSRYPGAFVEPALAGLAASKEPDGACADWMLLSLLAGHREEAVDAGLVARINSSSRTMGRMAVAYLLRHHDRSEADDAIRGDWQQLVDQGLGVINYASDNDGRQFTSDFFREVRYDEAGFASGRRLAPKYNYALEAMRFLASSDSAENLRALLGAWPKLSLQYRLYLVGMAGEEGAQRVAPFEDAPANSSEHTVFRVEVLLHALEDTTDVGWLTAGDPEDGIASCPRVCDVAGGELNKLRHDKFVFDRLASQAVRDRQRLKILNDQRRELGQAELPPPPARPKVPAAKKNHVVTLEWDERSAQPDDELRRQIDAWKDRPLNIRAITAVIDAYIAKPQPGTDRLRIAARREADSTGIILRMHLAPGKEGESLSRMDVEQWVSFSPGFSRNAIGEDRKYGVSRRNWLEFETTARGALSLPVERPIVIAVQVDLSD